MITSDRIVFEGKVFRPEGDGKILLRQADRGVAVVSEVAAKVGLLLSDAIGRDVRVTVEILPYEAE